MATRRQASFSYLDKAESVSVISFYVAEADVDVDNASGAGEIATLQSKISAVTLSNNVGRSASVVRTTNAGIPTNDAAYNGNKMTVYLKDSTTGDKYQVTIPAVDPAAYNTVPGTRNVILAVADGGTTQIEELVTAIEATALSKDGNGVSVIKILKSSARQGG